MTTALQSQSDARQWEAEGQRWWVVFREGKPIAGFADKELANCFVVPYCADNFTICVRRVWCRGMGEK